MATVKKERKLVNVNPKQVEEALKAFQALGDDGSPFEGIFQKLKLL